MHITMNIKNPIEESLFKKRVTSTIKKLILIMVIATLSACGSSGGGITIQEVAPPPGSSPETSALLTWDAPTTNTDGSCIIDHGGYNVYYSEDSFSLANLIRNANASCIDTGVDTGTGCGNIYECTYTVSSLTTGTWHFAVTAYDNHGNESELSNVLNKDIL